MTRTALFVVSWITLFNLIFPNQADLLSETAFDSAEFYAVLADAITTLEPFCDAQTIEQIAYAGNTISPVELATLLEKTIAAIPQEDITDPTILAACTTLEHTIVQLRADNKRKPHDKNFDHANINYLGVGLIHVRDNASVDGTLIVNNIEIHGHASGGFVQTLTGNTGGPRSPDAIGNINVVGTGVISVAGSGNTLTISSAGGASGVQALQGDTGGPIGPDGSGVIFIPGDHGIKTDGAGNTVTIAVDNTLTLGDIIDVTGSAALTATTGNVDIVAGNLLLPNTAASGDAGQIQFDGTRFVHNFGTENTFVGSSAGNITMTGADNTGIGFSALQDIAGGDNNTALGANALKTNNADDNTAVGAATLQNNSTGTKNSALGTDALKENTNGSRNTAIGYKSLTANTVSDNTGVGHNALVANIGGANNTAIGSSALDHNTSGARNTAVGVNALTANTTVSDLTAVGYNALAANGIGTDNTAIGSNALAKNVGGNFNTSIGINSLVENLTGDLNIALGANTLAANISGDGNNAVGSSTLGSNISGDFNTALGANALPNLSSGDQNIAIGLNAGNGYTSNETNNIVIGNPGAEGESGVIRIGTDGTHTACFIAGIRGATTGVADAVAVLIDSAGQLGTTSSSRRFKTDIRKLSENELGSLGQLEPQAFRYLTDPEGTVRYGLIAEDVAQIAPWLVVYDEKGLPYTVKYHELSIALLHEIHKLSSQYEQLQSSYYNLAKLEQRIQSLCDEVEKLKNIQA